MEQVDVQTMMFEDDGSIPNNPQLPLLIYPGVLTGDQRTAYGCRALFESNGWRGTWVNGVYSYHHYHSTAHEVLGVVSGSARVQFGGPQGEIVEVQAGDVAVLPAGTGHSNQGASSDFVVVGGYPGGQEWDLRRGDPGDRPDVLENIREVPLSKQDPVYGAGGPLVELWGGER